MLLRAYDDLTAAPHPDAIHDNPDNAEALAGFGDSDTTNLSVNANDSPTSRFDRRQWMIRARK